MGVEQILGPAYILTRL